jgi:dihydrofolate synthase/folylpolyglutamate synthase
VTCAITSIAFDHEQYLGHTLREIAGEKAGIIKPHVPVVVGAVDADAADAIRRRADACGAPLVWAMDDVAVGPVVRDEQGWQRFALRTPTRDYGEVRLALGGAHQLGNAVVAVRLLEQIATAGVAVTRAAIVQALDTVRWPGRLEQIHVGGGRDLLLDAAHNAAGAAALAEHLASLGAPRPLVFAAMRDKDAAAMLTALAPRVSAIVVTRASNPRSSEPAEIADLARRVAPGLPVDVADTPRDALAFAWARAPRIVVAGSIFLLADVMKELGRS